MGKRTIGVLAREGGVGVETVRYYEGRGLLPRPQRPKVAGVASGVRTYGPEHLQRLRFIRSAQTSGFTLKERRQLLRFQETDDRTAARALAEQRVAALDEQIASLATARDALARLARVCKSRATGPCPILTAFE